MSLTTLSKVVSQPWFFVGWLEHWVTVIICSMLISLVQYCSLNQLWYKCKVTNQPVVFINSTKIALLSKRSYYCYCPSTWKNIHHLAICWKLMIVGQNYLNVPLGMLLVSSLNSHDLDFMLLTDSLTIPSGTG